MHSLAFPLVTPAPKLCCPTLSNVFESWSGVTHIYSLFVCSTFSYVTHCYRRIIHQAHFNQISPREFLKNYEMTCLENRKSCVGLSTNWYRFDFFLGGRFCNTFLFTFTLQAPYSFSNCFISRTLDFFYFRSLLYYVSGSANELFSATPWRRNGDSFKNPECSVPIHLFIIWAVLKSIENSLNLT